MAGTQLLSLVVEHGNKYAGLVIPAIVLSANGLVEVHLDSEFTPSRIALFMGIKDSQTHFVWLNTPEGQPGWTDLPREMRCCQVAGK
jgi:hypothetical protein